MRKKERFCKTIASAMPVVRWQDLPIVAAERAPHFPVHASHSAIMCGGYCGCLVCGSVAGFHGHARLREMCRGYCPPGSSGPVSKLARGALPHMQRGENGKVWPSGESDPLVEKLESGMGVTISNELLRKYARRK